MFQVQIFEKNRRLQKIINDVRLHADGGILHCHMRRFALFSPSSSFQHTILLFANWFPNELCCVVECFRNVGQLSSSSNYKPSGLVIFWSHFLESYPHFRHIWIFYLIIPEKYYFYIELKIADNVLAFLFKIIKFEIRKLTVRSESLLDSYSLSHVYVYLCYLYRHFSLPLQNVMNHAQHIITYVYKLSKALIIIHHL